MDVIGVGQYSQGIAKGCVIIAAVALSIDRKRFSAIKEPPGFDGIAGARGLRTQASPGGSWERSDVEQRGAAVMVVGRRATGRGSHE